MDRALPSPAAPTPRVRGYMNSVAGYLMPEETRQQKPAGPIVFSPIRGSFTGMPIEAMVPVLL